MLAELLITCCMISYDPDPFYTIEYNRVNDIQFKYDRIETFHYTSKDKILESEVDFQFASDQVIELRKNHFKGTFSKTVYKSNKGIINSIDYFYENYNPTEKFHIESYSSKTKYFLDMDQEVKSFNREKLIEGRKYNGQMNIYSKPNELQYVYTQDGDLISRRIISTEGNIETNVLTYENTEYSPKMHTYIKNKVSDNYIINTDKTDEYTQGRELETVITNNSLLDSLLNHKMPSKEFTDNYFKFYKLIRKGENETTTYHFSDFYPFFRYQNDSENEDSTIQRYNLNIKIVESFNEDGLLISKKEYSMRYDGTLNLSTETVYHPKKESIEEKIEEEIDYAFSYLKINNTIEVLSEIDNESIDARIISMDGRTKNYKLNPGKNFIDVGELNRGGYLLQIMHESKPPVFKFIR